MSNDIEHEFIKFQITQDVIWSMTVNILVNMCIQKSRDSKIIIQSLIQLI